MGRKEGQTESQRCAPKARERSSLARSLGVGRATTHNNNDNNSRLACLEGRRRKKKKGGERTHSFLRLSKTGTLLSVRSTAGTGLKLTLWKTKYSVSDMTLLELLAVTPFSSRALSPRNASMANETKRSETKAKGRAKALSLSQLLTNEQTNELAT